MAKQHPTPEMVSDLAKLFKKHNWSGQPIGLAREPVNLAAMASDDADDDLCPDGSEPQWVSYKLPSGAWAQKKMCR
jgi:hypothetical protein